MAAIVLTNAKVQYNGNDISDHVLSVAINYQAAVVDNTAMNSNSVMSNLPALKSWSVDIELEQDYAAANLDSIMFPLVGTANTVLINPVNGANSTSNPQYSGSAILESYQPITGKVGDLAKTSLKLVGTGVLSRLTS
jgi:hypothetical protein